MRHAPAGAPQPELGSIVVALIRLRPDRTVQGYRDFSRDYVRAAMAQFESIIWFGDHHISPKTLAGKATRWQVAEVFAVTSINDFATENMRAHGVEVAERWSQWVEDSEVLLLEDLMNA